jgi:hypothetical protein
MTALMVFRIDFSRVPDVYLKKVDDEVGWGIFAYSPLEEGDYVGEYLGRVPNFLLSLSSLASRSVLSHCTGVVEKTRFGRNAYLCAYVRVTEYTRMSINALKRANLVRFVNHSSNPNLAWVEVFYGGMYPMHFYYSPSTRGQCRRS